MDYSVDFKPDKNGDFGIVITADETSAPQPPINAPHQTTFSPEKNFYSRAGTDTLKNIQYTYLDLQKIRVSAEIRADIVSKRELQHFEIFEGKDGVLFYQKQLFHENIKNNFPFIVKDKTLLKPIDMGYDSILKIELSKPDNVTRTLYLNLTSIFSVPYLLRKFSEQGMGLPMHRQKAYELLSALLDFICSKPIATKFCPIGLGWNLLNGKLSYETEKKNLWREVLQRAQ